MTANIKQNVTPRHRQSFSFIAEFSPALRGEARSNGRPHGSWRTRRSAGQHITRRSIVTEQRSRVWSSWQRGSVNQGTLTMAFAVVVLIAIVMLSFLYLQQVFGTTSQGADVQELKTRLIEVSEKQRELELQGAELRSIQNVEERIQQLNLVESTTFAYLESGDDRVALTAE